MPDMRVDIIPLGIGKKGFALFAVGFNTPPLGAVDFCNAWNTW
jgi:hypothetical protein